MVALLLTPEIAAAQSTSPAAGGVEIADERGRREPLSLSASAGIDYSRGEYGADEKTSLLVVPLSVRAGVGGLRVSATLPYLRIDSPGNVVSGGPGGPIIVDPNAPSTRDVRKGFGDLSLGAAYGIPFAGLDLDLSARVKLPTSARLKSLGTGKTDVAVRGELSKSIGTWTPFASVGYRFLGDPAEVDLRNSVSTSVGTIKQLGSTVLVASYDYARATTAAVDDAHELFAAVSGRLTDRVNLTTYGIAGLSEGSPEFGVGLLVTLKLR
jgi:hypothetical protein